MEENFFLVDVKALLIFSCDRGNMIYYPLLLGKVMDNPSHERCCTQHRPVSLWVFSFQAKEASQFPPWKLSCAFGSFLPGSVVS